MSDLPHEEEFPEDETIEVDEPVDYEVCQCINPKVCARHLVGQCDGQRLAIQRAPSPAVRTDELNGNLTFHTRYDPEWFHD